MHAFHKLPGRCGHSRLLAAFLEYNYCETNKCEMILSSIRRRAMAQKNIFAFNNLTLCRQLFWCVTLRQYILCELTFDFDSELKIHVLVDLSNVYVTYNFFFRVQQSPKSITMSPVNLYWSNMPIHVCYFVCCLAKTFDFRNMLCTFVEGMLSEIKELLPNWRSLGYLSWEQFDLAKEPLYTRYTI